MNEAKNISLKEKLQLLQEKLNEFVSTENIVETDILELSKELDKLIIEYYKR